MAHRTRLTIRVPMRPEVERGKATGQWDGCPIAAVVDTVGDHALAISLGWPQPTVNFRVDYVRPAIKTALLATAVVRRIGKSVAVVDVDVLDEAKNLVAIGRATYSTAAAQSR